MYLRKEKAGSSSTGHTWEEDGSIVEVPDHIGAVLLDHSREFADVTAEHQFWLATQDLERRKVTPPEADLTPLAPGAVGSTDAPSELGGDGQGEAEESGADGDEDLAGGGQPDAEEVSGQDATGTTEQSTVDAEVPAKRPYRRRTAVNEQA